VRKKSEKRERRKREGLREADKEGLTSDDS
jgi:hypothetical protein